MGHVPNPAAPCASCFRFGGPYALCGEAARVPGRPERERERERLRERAWRVRGVCVALQGNWLLQHLLAELAPMELENSCCLSFFFC